MDPLDDLFAETTQLGNEPNPADSATNKNRRSRAAVPKAAEGWGFGNSDGDKPTITATAMTTTMMANDDGNMTSKSMNNNRRHMDDDDTIPVIPDLEEDPEEDITRQVAAPPVAMDYNKDFRSLKELEPDNIERQLLNASNLHGVDISALMNVMVPFALTDEKDEVWDYGLIFQEISSHMNQEYGSSEKNNNNNTSANNNSNSAMGNNTNTGNNNANNMMKNISPADDGQGSIHSGQGSRNVGQEVGQNAEVGQRTGFENRRTRMMANQRMANANVATGEGGGGFH